MKKTVLALISIILSICLCSCGFLFPSDYQASEQKTSSNKNLIVNVHYDNEETKEYTITVNDEFLQCDFIAPCGKVIQGIYDNQGTKYAGYDCKIPLSANVTIPSDLYVKYEDIDISYLEDDPFTALDEKPTVVSYYKANNLTWQFDPEEYSEDEKMIAACICNPYADLTITISFMGKGDGTQKKNEFYSSLKVCDETIGSFKSFNLGDGYTQYTYSGTIKALQLTNGNYEVKVSYGSTYGYEQYTIKNIRVDFEFNLDNAVEK